MRTFAGCALTPIDPGPLLDGLRSRLGQGERRLVVGHHNLHSLFLCQHDAEVRRFYRRCETCYVDGMGVLWLLRAAGIDTRNAKRFSLMDCLPDLLGYAQDHGLSLFYLGASPAAVDRAEAWIAERWPHLKIALHHGYLSSPDTQRAAAAKINSLQPDMLLVGMGMPDQEAWINAHLGSLDAGVILQAGGTLDYYTGIQARPPQTVSRLGLAWLYRLSRDPRRLWRRYLVNPWSLLGPAWRLRRALRRGQEMP